MSLEPTEPMTQDEFARWLDDRASWDANDYELLDGRAILNPPAGYPHGLIGSKLTRLVGNFVEQRTLGQVFDSSQGFDLPTGDTVEPDFSFVSNARWTAAPPPVVGKFLRVVPDLVVETLSPSNASRDVNVKRRIYERAGVREYWIVDPHARVVTVFSLAAGGFEPGRVFADAGRVVSRVLDGFQIGVAELLPR